MKTKKDARNAGLKTKKEWFIGFSPHVPTKKSNPIIVKGEKFFCDTDVEPCKSKTAWQKLGFIVNENATPAGYKYSFIDGARGPYPVYKKSDTKQ
jgi:hypothetical protein